MHFFDHNNALYLTRSNMASSSSTCIITGCQEPPYLANRVCQFHFENVRTTRSTPTRGAPPAEADAEGFDTVSNRGRQAGRKRTAENLEEVRARLDETLRELLAVQTDRDEARNAHLLSEAELTRQREVSRQQDELVQTLRRRIAEIEELLRQQQGHGAPRAGQGKWVIAANLLLAEAQELGEEVDALKVRQAELEAIIAQKDAALRAKDATIADLQRNALADDDVTFTPQQLEAARGVTKAFVRGPRKGMSDLFSSLGLH